MTPRIVSPAEARRLVESGARLIDIRGADEFARARLPGAENHPLESLGPLEGDRPVVFHCRSGMRTASNASRLAECCTGPAYFIEGGLNGWQNAGLPLASTPGAPLEIMRQVQIVAGLLVLAGVLLGAFVAPAWLALAGFVGAGLTFAGITGWCGMATLLGMMPWNRRSKS